MKRCCDWTPAFAGVTNDEDVSGPLRNSNRGDESRSSSFRRMPESRRCIVNFADWTSAFGGVT
jgi:hypothetical protein